MHRPVKLVHREKFKTLLETRRREANRGKEHIGDSKLPAESLMHFYCTSCGDLVDTLPESYFLSTPKKLCTEYQALKDCGWLE